jgi:hypothetical protein
MNELNPAYLSVLATQLASIIAFLGGFAATYLGTLIVYRPKGLAVTLTISLAASAAVAFVVTVVAATMLTAMLHPFAPRVVQQGSPAVPQIIMTLGFALGSFCLLASLGSSGWIKSRTIGILTTTAACIGLLLILLMTVKIG